MRVVHITPVLYPEGHNALCGKAVSFTGDGEIGASSYGRGFYLNSSEKWCTLCQERFPLWELGSTDL